MQQYHVCGICFVSDFFGTGTIVNAQRIDGHLNLMFIKIGGGGYSE